MEVMECSLDKFYPIVFKNDRQMPEGKLHSQGDRPTTHKLSFRYLGKDLGRCREGTSLSPLGAESDSQRRETVQHPDQPSRRS